MIAWGRKAGTSTMKVLVADDEFYARKALVKMLNDIGLEVEVAADVETG